MDLPKDPQAIKSRWIELCENCSSTAIEPAPYSRALRVDDVVHHLKAYPSQEPNNLPLSTTHCIDFCERGTGCGPYGTLPEIRQVTGHDELFIFTAGNGLLLVKYDEKVSGFIVVEGYDEYGEPVKTA